MCPPLLGELVVEFASEKRLDYGAAGEEKRQKFHSRMVFPAFRRVIYIGVEGYT